MRAADSFGVGLFVYTSMDAIDGKQARRTGSSSPLGELFDHSMQLQKRPVCAHASSIGLLLATCSRARTARGG